MCYRWRMEPYPRPLDLLDSGKQRVKAYPPPLDLLDSGKQRVKAYPPLRDIINSGTAEGYCLASPTRPSRLR